jgi:ATP-dependent exoDNAse (exonuclease V) beta subunit
MEKDDMSGIFPGSVTAVHASAGSGKTYALAKRYLSLITDPAVMDSPDPLGSILAMTFTKKATVEMKERIMKFLKESALGPAPGNRQAGDIIEHIFSRYDYFQVKTIDSFINSVISASTFKLNMSSGLRIKDDHGEYLLDSLNEVLDRAAGDKKIRKAFEDLLRYYLYVEDRDGWFSRDDVLGLVDALFGYGNTYGRDPVIPGADDKMFGKKKQGLLDIAAAIKEILPEGTNRAFVRTLENFLARKGRFALKDIPNAFSKEEFPGNKGCEVSARVSALWAKIGPAAAEIARIDSEIDFVPYLKIYDLVIKEFRKKSSEDGVIFLSELNRCALDVLVDKGDVTELYYRLAVRIKHYLVDEFQDTSLLQWENISPLVDEGLSSGGTFFYVGDVKQAIYSFRGGESSLFGDVKKELARFPCSDSTLDTNYRTRRELVEFNNTVFSADNLERFLGAFPEKKKEQFPCGLFRDIAAVFAGSRQKSPEKRPGGFVTVEMLGKDDGEDDGEEKDANDGENGNGEEPGEESGVVREKLVSRIKDVLKRASYGDITVLARENSDIGTITSWLMEAGIPVASERTLDIREHRLVKEIVALLRFLDSPIDDVSFAAFVSGEIFTSASGISAGRVQDFIFRAKEGKKEKGPPLYRKFHKEFPDEWSGQIEVFFKSVGFIPPYELALSIYEKFKVHEKFPGEQGFLMKFLEVVKKSEEDLPSLAIFLEAFGAKMKEGDMYVNVTSAYAVRVMTVHKAKGLEFPIVIIPMMKMNVKVGTGAGTKKKKYVVTRTEEGLVLKKLTPKHKLFSAGLAAEYDREYTRAMVNELDTAYVAMTRAKDELHILIPPKAGSSKNIAGYLFPMEAPDMERGEPLKMDPGGKTAAEKEILKLEPSKYMNWIDFLKDDTKAVTDLVNRKNITAGEVFHAMLSCLGDLSGADAGKAVENAAMAAEAAYPGVETCAYIKKVKEMLKKENIARFFYTPGAAVFTEKEVVNASGDTKRMDRLIVTKDEVWVMDHKSSAKGGEGHIAQVSGYMRILRDVYPERTVKGFLLYLDTLTLEEVHG